MINNDIKKFSSSWMLRQVDRWLLSTVVLFIPCIVFAAAPVANDDSAFTSEDTAVIILVLDNDSDGDSDPLTITNVTQGANGSVSINASTNVVYTPTTNWNGNDSFTYWITDGNGGTDTGVVDVTVNSVNDPPSFTKGSNESILEDAGAQTASGWATSISKGPANESGQTLTFHLSTDNDAMFSVLPNVNETSGDLTYTVNANSNGSATVSIWLTDDGGGNNASATQTFTIAVTAVNDQPSFTKGGDQSVSEDSGPHYISGWATDLSKGPPDESSQFLMTMTWTDDNTLFSATPSVSIFGGALSYTPATNTSGTTTAYVVFQDNGGTANGGQDTSITQTFTIAINEVNDPPSFTKGGDQSVYEDDGAISVPGWASDISAGPNESGQTLTFHLTTDNDTLFSVPPAVDSSSGTLSYTPAGDSNGWTTVSIWLTDDGSGNNTSATQTFYITVNAVNDPPAFTKGSNENISEDAGAQTVPGWATAITKGPINESGQSLTFNLTTDNNAMFSSGPEVNATSGDLTYTIAADSNGTANVSVYLQDNGGTANGGQDTSTTQSFSIAVSAVNDPPSFTKGSNPNVQEDCGAQNIVGWATDIDKGAPNESGQSLTFHLTTDNNPLFSVLPDVDPSTGNLTFTPTANSNGTATVSVWLTDNGTGDNTSATQTFSIIVNAVNDAPSFAKGGNEAILEDAGGQTVTGWATSISKGPSDESSQTLTFYTSTDNDSLFSVLPSIDAASGDLTYTPAGNTNGSVTVSVWLSDNGGGDNTSATQTFSIAITSVNDAPSFTKGSNESILEDAGARNVAGWATAISAGGSDESGQALTFHLTTDNDSLFSLAPSVDPSNGNLSYAASANSNGSATVSIWLSDNGGTANGGQDTSTTQTFTIVVTAVNDPPSFTKGDNESVLEDAGAQTVVGWATAMDQGPSDESGQTYLGFIVSTDNDALFSSLPTVDSGTGNLTYTPAANSNGSATVYIALQDDGGTANGGDDTSSTQTFTIAVTAVNDEPSFTKGASENILEDAGAQTVAGWATSLNKGEANESSQNLTFHLSTDNDGLFSSLPTVDGTSGDLSYTTAAHSNGSATVSIYVQDDGGTANGGDDTSSTQTFTIAVTAVNDAPSFTKGGNENILEDAGAQTVAGWATAISKGPSDESAQTLSFALTVDNYNIFTVLPSVDAATGDLTYTPKANSNGTANVSIYLQDNGGTANGGHDTSTTQSFTIAITDVNDEPSFTKGSDQTVDEDCGPQTVTSWATDISKGPPNEAAQTLTFNISTDNDTLFSTLPAVNGTSGNLTFTPASNTYGSATVSIWLTDDGGTAGGGDDTSSTQTFTIAVNSVNDRPSFTKGSSPSVIEDCGAQTVSGWATSISAGPANESGESVTFHLTTDNDTLFSTLPDVDSSSGDLTFTPQAGSNGTANISIWLTDDGGTPNGGNDTSMTQSFSIVVTAVNDAPSFTKGANENILEDAGPQVVAGWATAIDKGNVDESGQTLTFHVSTDNDAMFATLPAVDSSSGDLSYTVADHSNGIVQVSIWLQDNGGTANGGQDTSTTQSFTIAVTPVNDRPSFTKGANENVNEDCGGQTVAGWASNINKGAPNEGSQTLTFTLTTDNDSLFSVLPAVDEISGDLTYTPTATSNGTATVSIYLTDNGGTANGGNDTSTTQTFSIVVGAVNDAPSFTKGANENILEDAGAQTVAGWATNMSKGPPDESSQTLTFNLTTDNDTLFSTLPAVDAVSGDLTYTVNANSNGSATVSIYLSDDGGTANGGNDTSTTQTFTIAVTAVNDVPSFTKGSNENVLEDCGAQTVAGWATSISKGPSDESGQTLTFNITTDNDTLFSSLPAVNTSSGDLTYTPAANSNGSATVSIWISDNGGTANGGQDTSTTQSFTIAITAVNDSPTYTKGANENVLEDCGAQTVTGWATALSTGPSDESGQSLVSFVLTTDNDNLFLVAPAVNTGNGDLTYTPKADSNGTATISVWLTDDGGTANGGNDTSTTQSFSIAVTAVNDAPSFTKGPDQNVLEDCGAQTVAGWASAISKGPANESSQALTFNISTDNDTLFSVLPAVDSSTGDLTFTPTANSNGSATVSIWLQDNGGNANGGNDTSTTQTFTIAVTAVNDSPTFTKGANESILEDAGAQTVVGWATDLSKGPSDETGQTLTAFYLTTDNDNMFNVLPSIDPTTGTLTYTPKANSNGTANVNVWLTDDGGTANGGSDTSSTQSFTIAITPVNDIPSFTKGSDESVLEDCGAQTVSSWATAISRGPDNESGQSLTFHISTDNDTLFSVLPAINSTSGDLTYTPSANSNGSATVSVWLMDDGGTANGGVDTTATQTFTVAVTAVNDTPSYTKGANQTVLEDCSAQTVAGWATDISAGPSDESGQSLTFNISTDNDALFAVLPAVDSSTGDLTFTPTTNLNGSATVTISLQDNGGTANGGDDESNDETFTISVTAVNDPPSYNKGGDQSVLEDCGIQTVAGWATSMSKGPPNESGQSLTFHVSSDNDTLFSAMPSIDTSTGQLSYTPAANSNGTAIVSVWLMDDGGTANGGNDTSSTQTFTIVVTPVNDEPSFTKGANETVLEDCSAQTVAGWATAISKGPSDESGQTLTFNISTDNDGLFAVLPAVDSSTGDLTYTPTTNLNGSATVTISLQDDGGTANGGDDQSPDETFTITVTAVNDPPSFTKGADESVLEDCGAQTVSSWATAISKGPADESGQTLSFTLTTDNDTMFSVLPAVNDATGDLTYTPAADSNGTATITIYLQDNGGTANGGNNTSTTQTFSIVVTAVNDEPSFTKGGNESVLEDCGPQTVATWATSISKGPPNEASQSLTFNISTDNDALFATLPAVDPATGDLTYTPATNKNGSATVTIELQDDAGTANGGDDTSSQETFSITVTAVNDQPTFIKGANESVLEDCGAQSVLNWATSISAGPTDESGQVLLFTLSTDNDALFSVLPSINPATGTLTYTPAADSNGTANVSVYLQDDGGTANGGNNTSITQSFTIVVTPVNDEPTYTKGGDQVILEDAGPQTVAGWATNISPGPQNETTQVLSFYVSTDNNTKFATLPAVDPATGDLTYTPATNANGTIQVTVTLRDDGGTANGGDDTSSPETMFIIIGAVNDAPSFTGGTNQYVLEDCGAQAVPTWATDISVGPADEAAQTISFHTITDNDSLFSSAPIVETTSGTLIFTPAANSNGTANVSIWATDNGGTDNGGQDTSATQTFTIVVSAVNDAPQFTQSTNQTVLEDCGPQTVIGWATNIVAGPSDETNQVLTFSVENNRPALFSIPPDIDVSSGTLTYIPATNARGIATCTVTLSDDGGTTNGGVNSTSCVFTITVNPVNDAPSFIVGVDQEILEDAGTKSITNWAYVIQSGPDNESSQTLTFYCSADNTNFFETQPAVNPVTGTLTYKTAENSNGTTTVNVWLKDDGGTTDGGQNTSSTQSFSVVVTAINDRPTFTKGSDQSVQDNAGPQTVATWATDLSTGPPDETNQTLTAFNVSVNNTNIFVTQPAIDVSSGDLTFTPKTNTTGTATVSVTLVDDGGTASGGKNTSTSQTFTIEVTSADRDFTITDIQLTPTLILSGQSFSAMVTVSNRGAVAADAGTITAWLDKDDAPTNGADGDISQSVGIVNGGSSTIITFSGLSAGSTVATNTFTAMVDSGNLVAETSETNNFANSSYEVEEYVTFTFNAFALTNNISLRWSDPLYCGMSNNTVHIRYRTDQYPANTSDGSLVYSGTDQVYEHTGLTPGQPCYYTIWLSHDGSNFVDPPTE